MTRGTKTVLYGAHCFCIHPFFVAAAWRNLYGFPWDIRLWIAFAVHDLGYVGKIDLDGPEGEKHVEFGARIMERLFGKKWGDFCKYHSRFYAKKDNQPPSKLCFADKLSIVYTPSWLYIPMAKWSGEIYEYINRAKDGKYQSMNLATDDFKIWHKSVKDYLIRWISAHKNGGEDKWTPR